MLIFFGETFGFSFIAGLGFLKPGKTEKKAKDLRCSLCIDAF